MLSSTMLLTGINHVGNDHSNHQNQTAHHVTVIIDIQITSHTQCILHALVTAHACVHAFASMG